MSYVDKCWHRWTIADAKEGDVLYSLDSCRPFIYKERKPYQQATAYCGINKYGKFFVRNTKDCIIVLDKYVPATKEQRDLLFQKMKEAGYKWDSEKKELEKIEEKPAIEWSKEDEEVIDTTVSFLEEFSSKDYIVRKHCINWLKSLKDRYTWKPSDEQIHWLIWVINRLPDTEKANEAEAVLRDLLEQLNKLREE